MPRVSLSRPRRAAPASGACPAPAGVDVGDHGAGRAHVVETTATVRAGSATRRLTGVGAGEQVGSEVEVALPYASSRRARPSGSRRRCRSETTAPPFWARPVWSSAAHVQAVDHRRRGEHWATRHDAGAADADDAHRRTSSALTTRCSARAGAATDSARPCAAACRAITVRNDGQSPARQEKSMLQEDWSICVLRPNSVSTGCTDRQLDFSPQSPQPSQTRSLMSTRWAGVGALPRLRLRRFSAAQAWSWISTVTPGDRRRARSARRAAGRGGGRRPPAGS